VKAEERHKLKQDKYADTMVTAWQWAKAHQSSVIAFVSAAVIVAGVVVWTLYSRLRAEQDAQAQFDEYQMSADRALGMKDPARAEAIQDALAHLNGLVKTYPNSEAAPQALLEAAELLSATGQPAKAAGYYERLAQMAGAPEGLKMLARRGLAASLEQSGDVERALAQYRELAAASAPQEAVEADWDIGRCCELLKDPENAKSFYRKAIELGPETKWAELARFRVESLDRGPTPPESAAPEPATAGPAPATTASKPPSTMSTPSSTTSTPSSTTSAPAATTAPAAASTAPDAAEKTAPK